MKIDIGHPSLACGEHDGKKRIIAIGDSGPGIYSDDFGKTWVPMRVKAEPWEGRGAKGIIAKGNVFLIVKGEGETVLRSVDGGMSWQSASAGYQTPNEPFVWPVDCGRRVLGHRGNFQGQPGRNHLARSTSGFAQRQDC